jgi:hypothetical protein
MTNNGSWGTTREPSAPSEPLLKSGIATAPARRPIQQVVPEEHAAAMVKAHPLTAAMEVSGHSGQSRLIEGGVELEAAAQCSA